MLIQPIQANGKLADCLQYINIAHPSVRTIISMAKGNGDCVYVCIWGKHEKLVSQFLAAVNFILLWIFLDGNKHIHYVVCHNDYHTGHLRYKALSDHHIFITKMHTQEFGTWWRHQMKNIFRVTGHLCGEFTGHRSPVNSAHKGQWRGVWCFRWSSPEYTVE